MSFGLTQVLTNAVIGVKQMVIHGPFLLMNIDTIAARNPNLTSLVVKTSDERFLSGVNVTEVFQKCVNLKTFTVNGNELQPVVSVSATLPVSDVQGCELL